MTFDLWEVSLMLQKSLFLPRCLSGDDGHILLSLVPTESLWTLAHVSFSVVSSLRYLVGQGSSPGIMLIRCPAYMFDTKSSWLSWQAFHLPRVESCEFFMYFGDQTLVWSFTGKYVFPYGWFPFHFADVFFSRAEAFYFDEAPFVYSFLHVPCSRGHRSENTAVWISAFSCLCSPLGL